MIARLSLRPTRISPCSNFTEFGGRPEGQPFGEFERWNSVSVKEVLINES
jgi:hypothetical protein